MIPSSIVVPLDGSDLAVRAVPVAADVARHIGARLVLMTSDWAGRDRTADAYLDGIADSVGRDGVERLTLDEPDAAVAIDEVVDSLGDGALVCMTTHGRGGIRWAMLGSVAEEVVTTSERPVLLVGPHCAPSWRATQGRVVLCHDGSRTAADLVTLACTWALALGQSLTVTTVIHPLDVQDAEHPEGLFDEVANQAQIAGLVPERELLRNRYVAGVLADSAASTPSALLVMATHGRAGLARVAIGSTALAVVGLVSCPVLIQRIDAGVS